MKKANLVFTSSALSALLLAACSSATPDDSARSSEDRAAAAAPNAIMKKSSASPTALAPISANLQYYGGKVIPNVKVYAVNWGPNVSAVVKNNMGGFYTAVTNSAYFDWLSEYNTAGKLGLDGLPGSNQTIGRGTYGGQFTVTPNKSGGITDADIKTVLTAALNSGALPAPDANAIYMFDFPPGASITRGTSSSCTQFCAYHGTLVYQGKSVPYGVHPDMSPGSGCELGCGSAPSPLDNYTSVHSHELIEAVTDMEVGIGTTVGRPLAWYDTSLGEIGDICNGQQAVVAGYTVQKQWSNTAGACIATGTALPANDFTLSDSPASETLAPGSSVAIQVKTVVASGSAAATATFTIKGVATSATHTASNTLTVSGTTGGTCAHAICASGGKLTAACDPCVAQICAADSFCCANSWDGVCVGEVASICGQACP